MLAINSFLAALRVLPIYNSSIERKPKVWLQNTVAGVRLRYRRSVSELEEKVEEKE